MLLKDKVVIVTGGSRGIGRGVALAAARHGADVVVNYRSDRSPGPGQMGPAEEVIEEIRAMGRGAIGVEADVADPETGKKLVSAAVDKFGKVDVLVSNAGICPFHGFLDMPVETFRQTMEVTLHGAST
jgi:L-rhamnose 1-dehydrogenase